MLTLDEVIWGFRYCLGRDPESEDVIADHRRFRNWGELRDALLRCPASGREGNAVQAALSKDNRLIFGPDSLCYSDLYTGDAENALLRNGVLQYDARRHQAIAEPVLFFGPYIPLGAGVYLVRFNGDLQGSLTLRLTHRRGAPLKEIALESFAEPLCLVLAQSVTEFEVVGEKTPFLAALRLDSIEIERVACAQPAEVAAA